MCRFNTVLGLSPSVRDYRADVRALASAAQGRSDLPGSGAFQNMLAKVSTEKIDIERPYLVDMKGT